MSFRLLFSLGFVAVAGLPLTGCAVIGGPYLLDDGGTAPDGGVEEEGPLAADATADAKPIKVQGSLLCHRSTYDCLPDDSESAIAQCGEAGTQACRVVRDATSIAPMCGPSGSGIDDAACQSAADCGPGFECVGYPGVCRHYCCEFATCAKINAQTYKPTFCDIQPQRSVGTTLTTNVPVCVPVQQCNLLKTDCGAGMTCAIVDTSAELISCVAIGPSKVGESCETQHCDKDLSCVGFPGSRTCAQLCDTSHPCPTSQTCKSQWKFLQPQGVGICE